MLPPTHTTQAHFLQDVIQPGALLAVTNLTYRGLDHTHNVPTVTVRDMTVFSHRPTDQHLCTAMDQLRAALPVSEAILKHSLVYVALYCLFKVKA